MNVSRAAAQSAGRPMSVLAVRACCPRCGDEGFRAAKSARVGDGQWLVTRECGGCGFRVKGLEVRMDLVVVMGKGNEQQGARG